MPGVPDAGPDSASAIGYRPWSSPTRRASSSPVTPRPAR